MKRTWFTSDTHFGAERTLLLSRRPFKSVEEMDREMIKKWNSVVGENDVVYHLGDFGNYDILPELNGVKHLHFGNYERNDFRKMTDREIIDIFMDKYGTYVSLTQTMELEMDVNKYIDKLILSHEPLINSKPISSIRVCNLFGHIHKNQMVKRYGLNVGVDCHHFFPINLKEVMFYIEAIVSHYDDYIFD